MSLTCLCTNEIKTYRSYKDHLTSPIHIKWLQSHPNTTSPVIIYCPCGEVYDFESQWRHLDRKRKNTAHQIWQLSQPQSVIDNMIVICYCGEAIMYKHFQEHKNNCDKRSRGIDIYHSN